MFSSAQISKLPTQNGIPHSLTAITHPVTTLPTLAVLAEAHYERAGNDLVIKLPTDTWVIKDYFLHPEALPTADGGHILVGTVFCAIHQSEPILLASAENVPISNLQKIAVATNIVNGPVMVQRPGGETRAVNEGDPIYLNDVVSTVAKNYIKITFNDGTVLQLGPLSRASLDKYSYQEGDNSGKVETSVFSGFFRYVSGKIGENTETNHTTIKTPSATIGIRGSQLDGWIDDQGSTTILHFSGFGEIQATYAVSDRLAVFETGTRVYIPIRAGELTRVSNASENEIKQDHVQWYPLEQRLSSTLVQDVINKQSPPIIGEPLDKPGDIMPRELGPQNPTSVLLPSEREPLRMPDMPMRESGRPPKVGEMMGKEPPFIDDMRPPFAEHQKPEGGKFGPNPPSVDTDMGHLPKPKPPGNEFTGDISAAKVKLTLQEDTFLVIQPTLPSKDVKITSITQPEHGKVSDNGDGTLTYTPFPDYNGPDGFTYVLDTKEVIPVELFVEPVPDAPIINMPLLEIAEDGQLVITPDDLLRHVVDPDNLNSAKIRVLEQGRERDLSVIPVMEGPGTLPNHSQELHIASVSPIWADASHLMSLTHGQVFIREDGNIVYIPDPNYNGEARFSFTVVGSTGLQSTGEVVVNLTVVNDAPVAVEDTVIIYNTFNPLSINSKVLLGNDFDVDQDALTITAVSNAVKGQVSLDNKGNIVFKPAADFVQGSFDYTISDGQLTSKAHVIIIPPTGSGVSGIPGEVGSGVSDIPGAPGSEGTPSIPGTDSSIPGTNPQIPGTEGTLPQDPTINVPPVALPDEIQLGTENTIIIPSTVLLANDSDLNHDVLRIISITAPINGQVALNERGEIVFTRSETFVDKGEFTYTVSDERGGFANGKVIVTGTNKAPLVLPELGTDVGNTLKNQPIAFTFAALLANDIAAHLPLTVTDVKNAHNGIAELDLVNQRVVFTPTPDYAGQDAGFDYAVVDAQGNTSIGTVIVEVINRPPEAKDDTLNASNTQIIQINSAELLQNDSDPDGDKLTLVKVTSGTNGQVELLPDGSISFFPEINFTGQATFKYTVADTSNAEAIGTVTVNVNGQASNPTLTANHDLLTTAIPKNTPVVITADQLLSNDLYTGDKTLLKITAVQNGTGGQVALQAEGNIVFTPDPQFVGNASFSYTVVDNTRISGQATVTVPVENRVPLLQENEVSTSKNTPLLITANQLLANDADPDGDTLTIVKVDPAVNGRVELTASGDVQFTPALDFTGKATFAYTVADGPTTELSTKTATTTVTINVAASGESSQPPVLTLPNNVQPLTYATRGTLVAIDEAAQATDIDSTHFDGGRLQAVLKNAQPTDHLEIRQTADITMDNAQGGTVSFKGTPMGEFTIDATQNTLTVQLNGEATPENVSALLQAVTYSNSATTTVTPHTVTAEFVLEDGAGGISEPVSRNINIQLDNITLQAVADEFNQPFCQDIFIPLSDLLINDQPASPTDTLQITKVTNPSAGVTQLAITNDEVHVFIDALLTQDFETATFDYMLSDGKTESSATVTIRPTNVIQGTEGGTDGLDIFVGTENADHFNSPLATDKVFGRGGEDTFQLDPTAAQNASIDGGEGEDTVAPVNLPNQQFDLSRNNSLPVGQGGYTLQSIERIDLSGSEGGQLRIRADDVLKISSTGQLTVDGLSNNSVYSSGQGWQQQADVTIGNQVYSHYIAPNHAGLLISQEVSFLIT